MEERLERLLPPVNEALTNVGVVGIEEIRTMDEPIGAAFLSRYWIIAVEERLIAQSSLEDGIAARLAGSVYHEARHAEQLFRALRWLAAQGLTAEELQFLGIPDFVINPALENPLDIDSSSAEEVEEAQRWELSMISGGEQTQQVQHALLDAQETVDQQLQPVTDALGVLEADPTLVNLSALYGQMRELGDRIVALEAAYAECSNLAHEVDAYEVEVEVYIHWFDNIREEMGE
jgi:hypothetical protein